MPSRKRTTTPATTPATAQNDTVTDENATFESLLHMVTQSDNEDDKMSALMHAALLAATVEHTGEISEFTWEIPGASGNGPARAVAHLAIAAATFGAAGGYDGSTHDSTNRSPVTLRIAVTEGAHKPLAALFSQVSAVLDDAGKLAGSNYRSNSKTNSSYKSYDELRMMRGSILRTGVRLAQMIHDSRVADTNTSADRRAVIQAAEDASGAWLGSHYPVRRGGLTRKFKINAAPVSLLALYQGAHDPGFGFPVPAEAPAPAPAPAPESNTSSEEVTDTDTSAREPSAVTA